VLTDDVDAAGRLEEARSGPEPGLEQDGDFAGSLGRKAGL